MLSNELNLVVAGPGGEVARDLGPAGPGLMNGLAWAPDGSSLTASTAATQGHSPLPSAAPTER